MAGCSEELGLATPWDAPAYFSAPVYVMCRIQVDDLSRGTSPQTRSPSIKCVYQEKVTGHRNQTLASTVLRYLTREGDQNLASQSPFLIAGLCSQALS